jgi:hypothetical protein
MSDTLDTRAILAALDGLKASQQALGRSLQAARLELAGRWWRANVARQFSAGAARSPAPDNWPSRLRGRERHAPVRTAPG